MARKETLSIRLFGDMSVVRGGVEVRLPQSKKTRALLAYLILTGRPQRRARLCSLLWDVADDPRGALRWSLSKLRPLVNQPGHTRIQSEGDHVRFAAEGVDVDILRVREVLRRDMATLDTATLREVADLHRGELLQGLDMGDFDEFQSWSVAEREDARIAQAALLRTLTARLRDTPEQALPYARALVRIEPVDEAVRVDLVTLLASAGRPDEARQQAEAGLRQLRELGVGTPLSLLDARRGLSAAPPPPLSRESLPPPTTGVAIDSPLVGRRAERARLFALLDEVAQERGERIVLLSGEPGVGKSRLLAELLEEGRRRGGVVASGRAFEAERGRPFGPWIDGLRAWRPDREDEPRLEGRDLASLLGSNGGAPSSREQMFATMVDLLRHDTKREAPTVVGLDDVQWIDEDSAELLHYVARQLSRRPILFALTARAGEIVDNEPLTRVLRGLRRERLLRELELGPLNQADTEALVAAVAPGADRAEVYARSGGNPLFALELARSGDAPDAAEAGEGAPLPSTVSEVVQARVERLPAPCGDVLRWAATVGPRARLSCLAVLTELPEDELLVSLEHLERHALLRSSEDGVTFAHNVVRHAVYLDLSEPRRRLMHAKIARALGETCAADEASAAEVAHHAHLAGRADLAASACVSAARRSLGLFAKADAVALIRRGFRYVTALPEPTRTTMAIELHGLALIADQPDDPEAVAKELEELSERALDAGEVDHARSGFRSLAYLRWERGHAVDAARHMLYAERLTRGGDARHRAAALADAARCLVRLDRDIAHAEALSLEARAVASKLEVVPFAVPEAEGMLRAHAGERGEAARRLRSSYDLARRAQDHFAEFEALEQLVMLELTYGCPEDAREPVARLARLGAKMREGSEGPVARTLEAVTSYAEGDDDARDRILEGAEDLRVVDAKQRLAFTLLATAQADLARGRAEEARALRAEAIDLAAALRHGSYRVWGRALVAQAAVALGDHSAFEEQRRVLADEDLDGLAAHAREAAQAVLAAADGPRDRPAHV
ncbi:MAG: AAA family ATPase [Sandaracinaceae bacterium]